MTSEEKKKSSSSAAAVMEKVFGDKDKVLDQALLEHPSYLKLQEELTAAEEKAAELNDRVLRTQAETANAQRRMERDIANAHKYALEKFLNELLPILDGLERAVDTHQDEEGGSGSLLDGVRMTLKMFYAAFEKFGIEQINPVGQPFNPEFHQAIKTEPASDKQPGTVLNVLQKGYLLNNRLVRPAMVIVAQ